MNSCYLPNGQTFPFSTPSIFSKMGESISSALNSLSREIMESIVKAELEKQAIEIISETNYCIAEMETYRSLMSAYYINDLAAEEDIFTDLCLYFDDISDKVEVLQEKDISSFPDGLPDIIAERFSRLYEESVLAKFEASQKIAGCMIDGQED
jgi:hypothetical protein